METLRIKYERGPKAAKKYQERCKEIDDEFQRIFIERNINFQRDFDHSCVRDFIETKNFRASNLTVDEHSHEFVNYGDSMSKKTKALYMCIKKQISKENHPVNAINNEFAIIFCKCYKQFVNKTRTPSSKLIKTMMKLNNHVAMMQSDSDLPSPRAFNLYNGESSETSVVPTIRDKPNYFLTSQVISDIKMFINIMLKTVINYYEPVIREHEMAEMKEDIIETITNLILSKDVYKIMFSFFRLEYTKIEENLKDRYEEFKRITPAECRVNEYFRLDDTSPLLKICRDIRRKDLKCMFSEPMSINFEVPNRFSNSVKKTGTVSQSLVEENKSSLYLTPKEDTKDEYDMQYVEKEYEEGRTHIRCRSKSEDKYMAVLDPADGGPRIHSTCDFNIDQTYSKRFQAKPFHDAIVALRDISIREGPMMKLRLLEKVNQMIKDAIWDFWRDIPINQSHLVITQDTKIPLYIYVVIKSKIIDLPAHIRFIQEFTTNYVHENNLGANLALYESAMTIVADKERNMLLNVIDQNEVVDEIIRYNESFATSVFIDDIDPFVEFTPARTTLKQ